MTTTTPRTSTSPSSTTPSTTGSATSQNGGDEREHAREVKTQTDAAIACALAHEWSKAVEANRAVLQIVPANIEALNRLAKALLELGELKEARTTIDAALELNASNTIARRNRERLERAESAAGAAVSRKSTAKKNGRRSSTNKKSAGAKSHANGRNGKAKVAADAGASGGGVVSSRLLMSETGKSTITTLIDATDRTAVGHLSSGEALTLSQEGSRLLVHSGRGEPVGRVHPRLAKRVLSLMDAGNRYEAAFLRDDPKEGVQIIIGEVYQHPSQNGRPSFLPSSGSADFRGYVRNSHELVDSGLGGPPARDTSDDENATPEFEALVRAHDRGELKGQRKARTPDTFE